MATDSVSAEALLGELADPRWATVRQGIDRSETWLKSAHPGDPRIAEMGERLAALGKHDKWEVRRAVANLAGRVPLSAFETILIQLRGDENARVRQAAHQAQVRRRDWRSASSMGRDQEKRINETLDDIERRFGPIGRLAVRKASESMANMFARELYHEIVRLISPVEAEKLEVAAENQGSMDSVSRSAKRISTHMQHLRAVLEGMRAFTAEPVLKYETESLREAVEESVRLASDTRANAPRTEIDVPEELVAEIARARFVQALTNVMVNAIEAYARIAEPHRPIAVTGSGGQGYAIITITDRGCGMAADALDEARTLFATNKKGGAGVGLPLAIKIVEAEHAGQFRLSSEEGKGTVVHITVPTVRVS
jgi:signal transduction histidine kinase